MSTLEITPTPVQKKFLQASEHIVFFGGGGGGGKTYALLVDNLQGVHDPDYFSVFFRTTTTEIDKGLWPEAKKLYDPLLKNSKGKYVGKAHINEQTKTITFPSGARTAFSYLELDKHADSWYGSEICREYFDEFQFRSPYQFEVLRSRNRSRAEVPVAIRCSLNPDQNHFVYQWVEPFLDEEGFPIKELSGKTRYYTILNDVLHTSWDEAELRERTGKTPKTYTYVPATVDDNPHVDPGYRDTLDALGEAKRKQLLMGCWHTNNSPCLYFKREWCQFVDKIPTDLRIVRGWDFASTTPHPGNPSPDYTACVKIGKDRPGNYYILDADRFRKSPGERDYEVMRIADEDGPDVVQILPKDPGQAGVVAFQEMIKKFIENGNVCKQDTSKGDKVIRFSPFSSAAQGGIVYICTKTFKPDMLQVFLKELEAFEGSKSTATRKDDLVDATASAFNYLCKQKVIPTFTLQRPNSPTMMSHIKGL